MTEVESRQLYICVGENIKPGVNSGHCGDMRTLASWLWVASHSEEYCEKMMKLPPSYAVQDLYYAYGKRLEKVKRGRSGK